LETIAGLKVELGLERVDLVGGNGGMSRPMLQMGGRC
jgi:hypothetical protein